MALTQAALYKAVPGAEFESIITVTGDSSYPAGGYLLTPAMFGLNSFAVTSDSPSPTTLWPTVYGAGGSLVSGQVEADVDSTGHLRFFYPSGGGAASPAALSAPAITSGATAVTSSAANGTADLTPGQGKEVATATNLTTVTCILRALGH